MKGWATISLGNLYSSRLSSSSKMWYLWSCISGFFFLNAFCWSGYSSMTYCKMRKADYYKYCMQIHKLGSIYIISPNCFSCYLPLADGRWQAAFALCIIHQVDYFLFVNEMGAIEGWVLWLCFLHRMKSSQESVSPYYLPHSHLQWADSIRSILLATNNKMKT